MHLPQHYPQVPSKLALLGETLDSGTPWPLIYAILGHFGSQATMQAVR